MAEKEVQVSTFITPKVTPVLKEEKFTYSYGIHLWTIHDFMKRYKKIERDKTETYLRSNFSAFSSDQKKYDFRVEISPSMEPNTAELFLLSDKKLWLDMIYFFNETPLAKKFEDFVFSDVLGWHAWQKLEELNLENDTLEIVLHYAIRIKVKHNQVKQNGTGPQPFEIQRSGLETLSDFSIRCGGKTFPVHKIVLANSSTFFKKMFLNDKPRNESQSEMEIEALAPEHVDMMINAMYTHELDKILTLTQLEILLEAADTYGIQFLNLECGNRLKMDYLGLDTSAHFLRIGLKFNCPPLAQASQSIVLTNIQTICRTKEYAKLMMEYPSALVDVEDEENGDEMEEESGDEVEDEDEENMEEEENDEEENGN